MCVDKGSIGLLSALGSSSQGHQKPPFRPPAHVLVGRRVSGKF